MLSTRACRLLECEMPVLLAGMGGVARSELVSAVTAAGGFGFLGMVREPPDVMIREIKSVRRAGHSNFGVNIIPAATDADLLTRQVDTCIDLDVPVVCLFWDVDVATIGRLREAGIRVVHQVGSPQAAAIAVSAGAELIIGQGVEAGGHVWGERPLWKLLPEVVAAVDVPVLAAGGLGSGADLVAALALGGDGIVLGTAFMATTEAFAHEVHKERLVAAQSGDTVLTTAFHINWPAGAKVRVLDGPVTRGERGDPFAGQRVVIGDEEGRPIYLFSTDSPLRSMTGTFADMALYAGAGVGAITAIVPAGERLHAIVSEAEALLDALPRVDGDHAASASPVCYVGEVGGTYMGLLEDAELANIFLGLRNRLRRLIETTTPAHRGVLAAWTVALDRASSGLARGVDPTEMPVPDLAALAPKIAQDGLRQMVIGLAAFLRDYEVSDLALAKKPDRIVSSSDGSARVE